MGGLRVGAGTGRGATGRSGAKRGIGVWRVVCGFAALGAVVAAAYPLVVRPWHLRWGASDAEVSATLPGDDIVPRPVYQYTRAITVDAPPEAVWPWLAQMGQGRGGLYSYDWLENLAGCDIHSADRILPEFQNPRVGDTFRLYREGGGPPPLTVARVEPNRAFVLAGGEVYSWAFVLQPIDRGHTRLLERARAYAEPAWLAPLMNVEPIDFLMSQKMLWGIKERVEAAPR